VTEHKDLNSDEIEVLEAKETEHGEVWYLKTATAFVVFRCPKPHELKRLKALVADDKKSATSKADADVTLVRDVVVHPAKPELEKLIERRPALAARIAAGALEAAADEETKEAKKYESVSTQR
jgi:hypothetical protein